jgi:transposase
MARYPAMVRKRIVELYQQQFTTKQIAELFGVARSGVRRVKQRLRERGTLEDRPARVGRKPLMTPEVQQQIREHIARHPDATREELKAALDLTVSVQSISKWLKRLGLPLKKSPSTPASRTARTSRPAARSGTTS